MASKFKIEQEASLKAIENFNHLEHLRKIGIYVWAFPIRYPDKTTFGWEYELPDGRTSWYNEELPTYEQALFEGIKAANNVIIN